MRVKEWRGSVVFLHEVAEGAAGRSWGVHVAQLAGVPAATVKRAGGLLAALEKTGHGMPSELPLFANLAVEAQEAEEPAHPDALRDAVGAIDPDRLTPREALEALYALKLLATTEPPK